MKNVYKKLLSIQKDLKVKKGKFSEYGGYSYRSAEDINEALKPIAQKHNCLFYTDTLLEMIGVRYYVKAVVTMVDVESGEILQASAYAREDEERKKMDSSQLTGSATSYARKYAYGGLLNLDDYDSDELQEEPQNEPTLITETQLKIISKNYQGDNLRLLLEKKQLESLEQMSYSTAKEIIDKLKEIANAQKNNS